MDAPGLNQPPQAIVEISDFKGMISDLSPNDLPDGAAQAMVNIGVTRPGEMSSRGGLRVLRFDDLIPQG